MTHRSPVYLRIAPDSTISFDYIPRKYLTSRLILSNPSSHNVAFKVKTTVPTSYLVKPHNGCIPPNSSLEVNITMQPTEYTAQTPILNDKFLVSAFPLNSETDMAAVHDPVRFNKLWAEVSKTIMQNKKLSVALNFENIRLSLSSPKKSQESTFDSSESPKTSVNKPEEVLSPVSPMSSSGGLFAGFETPKRTHFGSFKESAKQNSVSSFDLNMSQQKVVVLQEVSVQEESGDDVQNALEKKRDQLQGKIDELAGENVLLDKRIQTLIDMYKQQDSLQEELTKENEQLLLNLKDVKNKVFNPQHGVETSLMDKKTFDIWNLLTIIIIGLILGYLLGPN